MENFLSTTNHLQKINLPQSLSGWQRSSPNYCSPYAAVALIFIEPEHPGGFARIIVTKRSLMVKTHKGQMSLPGGHDDESDGNLVETALREAYEEVGIPTDKMECLGYLTPTMERTGKSIYPVVFHARIRSEDLVPCSNEVSDIFCVPWDRLQASDQQQFRFNLFGVWRTSALFTYENQYIWGLTAQILASTKMTLSP